MTIQAISLSSIVPSRANPRKKINCIEELAASIKQDGLLQNLVVEPSGKRGEYRIVSGERRYRALMLLSKNGDLPENFEVNVEIREDLSKYDSLRIGVVENLQRMSLAPLEETAALTKLIR